MSATLAELLLLISAVSWVIPWLMVAVVPRNRRPASALGWLLLMFMVPLLGLVIFLLIGSPKLSRRRREQQRTMDAIIARDVAAAQQHPSLKPLFDPPLPERYIPAALLSRNLGGLPPFAGNAVELLPEYDAAIAAVTQAIDCAERHVHVEYFIIALDDVTEPFFAALERAVARGVKVRLLLDHIGSLMYPRRRAMLRRLTAAGVEWREMLPVRIFDNEWSRLDLRNHRKIVVVDSEVAFTGSQNMIDRSYHKRANLRRGLRYDELVVRVRGPVVAQLQAVFVADWFSETGVLLDSTTAPDVPLVPPPAGDLLCQVLPSGPGHDDQNNLKLFTTLIHGARRRLTIASPYVVPDEALLTAITSTAQRGVTVSLLVPEIGDQFMVFHAQRSYYEELLRAGVQICLYRAPMLLHSKFMLVDDDIAVIGSSNMDIRSFELDLEVSLLIYDAGFGAALEEVIAGYMERSRELRLDEWQRRPLLTRFLDNTMRLTAALQ